MSMVNFFQQKSLYRNKLIESTGYAIPSVVLISEKRQKWNDFTKLALEGLCLNTSLTPEHLKEVGIVAKIDYTCAGDGVYLLTYTSTRFTATPYKWICSNLCIPDREVTQTVNDKLRCEFQPFCKFIKEEETRLFISPQSHVGDKRITDLFVAITNSHDNGDMTYSTEKRDVLRTWYVKPKYKSVVLAKKSLITAMRATNLNWARALVGTIIRIDMAFGKVMGDEDESKLYINEIDVFPLASTLLIKSSENLDILFDISFMTFSQIVNNVQDGQYFCS